MTEEHAEFTSPEEVLARHQAYAEVLQGQRAMTWSDWAMCIYESQCLTPAGQRVALWAVETLERILGTDFLHRAAAVSLLWSLGLWPANDVPWVYANLFQLALRIKLLDTRLRPVLKTMRRSVQLSDWIHVLLQLELAAFGVREGWQVVLEPVLETGKRADVELISGSTRLLLEMVSMRMSDREQEALTFFHTMSQKLSLVEMQYAVHISGSLGSPLSVEDANYWVQEIEEVARSVARNGIIRLVSNHAGGQVEIAREQTISETVRLEGAPVTEDTWGRLVARLNDKNHQAEGAGPVWVRLEEYAGLWQFSPLQGMTLPERLGFLAPALQAELVSFQNLAGVILSPVVLWAGNAPVEVLSERIERDGSIALRCPIPGHRVRESIIVARVGAMDGSAKRYADWYTHEASWLDWALEQQGHPPFAALIQEPPM